MTDHDPSFGTLFSQTSPFTLNFWSWLLFRYPFHPCVSTVARKDPGHSTKSAGGRFQSHAPYFCGFAWSDTVNWQFAWSDIVNWRFAWSDAVNWRMDAWCTQNVRRDCSSFMNTSHATTKQCCKDTTWMDIKKRAIKSYSPSFRITYHMQQEHSDPAWEQRTALYETML